MAGSTDLRYSPQGASNSAPTLARARPSERMRPTVVASGAVNQVLTTSSPVRFVAGVVGEFKDRRRRRRVAVPSMYTSASIRVLSRQGGPLEGHVVDLSENGMAVQLDEQIAIGAAVTAEFSVAGLGRQRPDEWPTYAIAAEVVRIDGLEEFPGGPYRTALRFVRIPTMVQAQIARFVVMQPAAVS